MTARKTLLTEHLQKIDGASPTEKLGKHIKMASSPFLFFRGSAQLFYRDLKNKVLALPDALLQLPQTTIMGDCHTSNFGFITEEGSHGDKVIFTVNDFDDACIGHGVWDLSRYISSLFICTDHCQKITQGKISSDKPLIGKTCINEQDAVDAASAFLTSYLSICQQSLDDPDFRYQSLSNFDDNPLLAKRYLKACQRASGGQQFATESTLAKAINWQPILSFQHIPDRFKPLSEEKKNTIKSVFAPYVDDHIHDVVERLNAGTGSVNLARYYLLVGPSQATSAQLPLCHIVEVKQQRLAAPLYFFNDLSPVNQLNPAHLTVNCQRKMQRNPDLVLDEVEWQGAHWLVRSRHHAKVGIKPEHIGIGKKVKRDNIFVNYAGYCGKALALAHCRGDRRSNLFEQAMLKELSKHQSVLIESCRQYCAQVNEDTQWLNELMA